MCFLSMLCSAAFQVAKNAILDTGIDRSVKSSDIADDGKQVCNASRSRKVFF